MLTRQLNDELRLQDMYEEISTKSKTKERKLTSMQNEGYKEKKHEGHSKINIRLAGNKKI